MAELRVHRVLLLVISLAKSLETTKLLAELKKCGDLECETLISRVTALQDYEGPDCRYLNFTKGEEISVYVKLSGEREDLWAGSKGKDFGYFPRDAVQIEEVFISEEVQVSTKESDFFCLLGGNYIFENEDNELNSDTCDPNYLFEEDEDQISSFYEHNTHIDSGFYSTSESTLLKDQFLAVETPDDTSSISESKALEEVETENVQQDNVQEETLGHIPEVDHAPPASAVPEGMGWFALTTEQTDRQTFEPVIEPVQESSFQSRKIAVLDENDLEELNNNEHQIKHNQEPDLEIDAVPDKQSEITSESEHILKPQATGWFGSGFTSYLGFGDQDTSLELLSKESNQPLQDVPNPISSDEETTVPCEEIIVEEDPIINDSSTLKSSWFDFGFGMLGFAHVKEDKMISDGIKNEEKIGGDKNEPPPLASESDLDKKQETEISEIMETEDQINKKTNLEKTDDSDTVPYFKRFLYNFDNPWSTQKIPKDKELLFPKQTGDEGNGIENEQTEEFSVENDPTDNTMSKSSSSTSDLAFKTELPMRIQEEMDSQIRSSENNEDESNTLQLMEGYPEVEIYGVVENTQLNGQIFSSDNSVPSQNHIPQEEDALEFQILKYVFQINVYDFLTLAFSPILFLKEMVSWIFTSFGILLAILINIEEAID
ncbi:PREDICTED: melanoma inhibitory activity protein 2 [Elephantulus edwardii]|uniref:melanoma inhibitory activity protein 2 n=1 Tax=Elephantulus edwardii TaxID=28737 RepID=UPI0003F0C56E|nr:PREDICTED: melanoma inhibitory activity protein 2 [Elephantulus edwardii]